MRLREDKDEEVQSLPGSSDSPELSQAVPEKDAAHAVHGKLLFQVLFLET